MDLKALVHREANLVRIESFCSQKQMENDDLRRFKAKWSDAFAAVKRSKEKIEWILASKLLGNDVWFGFVLLIGDNKAGE